jgi:epoxyqueuosine reductase
MTDLGSFAIELGFDDFGVADATLGTPYGDNLKEALAEGLLDPLDYMGRTKDERSDIQMLMPGAKSVIVVVKNYYAGDHANFVPLSDLSNKCRVSRYAWGGDYHHWFRKRLRKMRTKILAQTPEARVHIFNDTGPVLERAWAVQAGLGFIGKSSLFIHRRFGTWTFLGGLVTDVEMETNKTIMPNMCGTCTRCLLACPTQAITAPYKVDARRCLTTWNVERPLAPQAQEWQGHKWVVGCDICQEVCPWNKFEQITSEERFWPRQGHVAISEVPKGDLAGTPLARAKREGIEMTLARALASSVLGEPGQKENGRQGQDK